MLVIFILLFTLQSCFSSSTYDFVMEDQEIFRSCENAKPWELDLNGLFDTSKLSTTMSEEGIIIEGNMTLAWEIEIADRLELSIEVFYFDRGSWTPTVFSMKSKDFCKSMYNKNQYWYEFYTKHIKNSEDVKNNCLNVPGTTMVLETYILRMKYTINGQVKNGRYKFELRITAFDQENVMRPNSICLEIRGDFNKI